VKGKDVTKKKGTTDYMEKKTCDLASTKCLPKKTASVTVKKKT